MQSSNLGVDARLQISNWGGCNLSALKLLRFRFVLRSHGIEWTNGIEGNAAWSLFKGFPFYGALGKALNRVDPLAFQGMGYGGRIGPTFVLTPPWDHQKHYQADKNFVLEITMLGHAISHMRACCAALHEVGQGGVDKARGKFDVINIQSVTPCGSVTVSLHDEIKPVTAYEIAASWRDVNAQYVGLRFVTPTLIKDENTEVKHIPTFRELMKALFERLYRLGVSVSQDEKRKALAGAERVLLIDGEMKWVEGKRYERYSSPQKIVVPHKGLLGEAGYQGDLTAFMPYLALLEYVNLGGHTALGFGKCLLRFEK